MKRFLTAIALGCALAASGCATLGMNAAPQVQISAAKTLGLSWAALDGAANGLEAARASGAFVTRPQDEVVAYQALSQARAILRDADAAWHADQHADPSAAIANVADLIARVRALSPNPAAPAAPKGS